MNTKKDKNTNYRYTNHTVSRLITHIVWITKYRYNILQRTIKPRMRELLTQIYDNENVKIIGGVVSQYHVHSQIEYPPKLSIVDLVKKLKGRTSRIIQKRLNNYLKDTKEHTFRVLDMVYGRQVMLLIQLSMNISNIITKREVI